MFPLHFFFFHTEGEKNVELEFVPIWQVWSAEQPPKDARALILGTRENYIVSKGNFASEMKLVDIKIGRVSSITRAGPIQWHKPLKTELSLAEEEAESWDRRSRRQRGRGTGPWEGPGEGKSSPRSKASPGLTASKEGSSLPYATGRNLARMILQADCLPKSPEVNSALPTPQLQPWETWSQELAWPRYAHASDPRKWQRNERVLLWASRSLVICHGNNKKWMPFVSTIYFHTFLCHTLWM